jgi:hypothetical protein
MDAVLVQHAVLQHLQQHSAPDCDLAERSAAKPAHKPFKTQFRWCTTHSRCAYTRPGGGGH